jgi:phage gpG-like protein
MSKFQFLRKAAKFKAAVPQMLDRMANNAVNHFKVTNFDAKGFVDASVRSWAPIKEADGRQPLVRTGRMRASITILGRSFNTRLIGSDVPYASFHNTGTKSLPQRKMIGNSKALEKKNGLVVLDTIKRIV